MPIGTITIPLAVAGPVHIYGAHAQGEFLLPVATTEGALVASINRGAKTLAESGGRLCFAIWMCMQKERCIMHQ